MDIQRFTSPVKPSRPMRVVKYPPEVAVRMLGNPCDCLKLWLHWRGAHSFPCLGDTCVDCREDRFPYGYCPVQVGQVSGMSFYPKGLAILPVTTDGLDLCLAPLQGKVIEVSRRPCNLRGHTIWKVLAVDCNSPIQPFDVLPHLENLWAWFLKKDGYRDAASRVAAMSDLEVSAVCGKIGQSA